MESNLERIVEVFQKMKASGWEVNSPLKWGFFFIDEEKAKLERIFEELKDYQYILEGIYQPEDEKYWVLHASKVETLNPEKLNRRNISFNDLANYFEVAAYDGWDVGKVNE